MARTLCVFIFVNLLLMSNAQSIRYVALGDSYTIGTGAPEGAAWPSLLTAHLKKEGIPIELVANPARNGWTSRQLIDQELPVLRASSADFVTILVGTNDWVQGVEKDVFRKNLGDIMDEVQRTLPDPSRVLVLTIPDFSVTPEGKRYSGGRDISKGLSEFNEVILEEAKRRQMRTVDLFAASKAMAGDENLVSGDGLHPSAKGYAVWEALIYPVAKEILKK